MSGTRNGLAYLTFTSNFTFTATEVLVPKKPQPSSVPAPGDSRGTAGDSRNPNEPFTSTSTTTSGLTNNTSIFGFITNVDGTWTFDDQGRVFGYFAEKLPGPCVTNGFILVTNGLTVETNPIVDCSSTVTTTVSFNGKVSPDGRHLQLVCSTSIGKVTYRGVPAVQLTDFSGPFFGVKKGNGIPVINETFSLSLETNAPIPNLYDVTGMGPGYDYIGVALVSSQNRMGFVSGATNSDALRSVTGSFNLKAAKGNLSGWDQPPGPLTSHITFRVVKE
jgi:hypothetical protein